MARYAHLPIWKDAIDLAVHLEKAVRRFPRYHHKYSLGSDLRQCARRLCRLVTRANEARAEARAKVLEELAGKPAPTGFSSLDLPPAARERLRAQIASHRAHLAHASSHRLWQRTVADFPWLAELFDSADTSPGGPPLRPAWQPVAVTGIASQYRYFAQRYPHARVLIEVGNRWLLPVDATCGSGLGRDCRRPASADLFAGKPAPTRHYPGLGACIEYRASDLPGLRRRWKRQGVAHALVAQDGHFKTGFKRRALRRFWRPATVSPSFPLSTCRGVS